MGKAHNFNDLEVWQLARKLSGRVYGLTGAFPSSEQFGLTPQVRRAAISIPLNISEGHGLRSNAGFARHLKIALGSLNEVETAPIIAADLGLIASSEVDEIQADCTRLGVKISNLIGSFSLAASESVANYGDPDLVGSSESGLSSTNPQLSST